jgi:hypothetical protein
MTTEVLTLVLTAGQQTTVGQGRLWYVKSATSSLVITAETIGSGAKIRKFTGVGAGFKFVANEGDGWTYLRITSAVSQNIELILGDDDVEVANAVSVTGAVTTISTPASGLTASAADVSVPNGSASSIAANLSRKSLTIGALSTNAGSLRVQSVGAGANKGRELQGGTTVTYCNTGAFDVRNDSGGALSYWLEEEI